MAIESNLCPYNIHIQCIYAYIVNHSNIHIHYIYIYSYIYIYMYTMHIYIYIFMFMRVGYSVYPSVCCSTTSPTVARYEHVYSTGCITEWKDHIAHWKQLKAIRSWRQRLLGHVQMWVARATPEGTKSYMVRFVPLKIRHRRKYASPRLWKLESLGLAQ